MFAASLVSASIPLPDFVTGATWLVRSSCPSLCSADDFSAGMPPGRTLQPLLLQTAPRTVWVNLSGSRHKPKPWAEALPGPLDAPCIAWSCLPCLRGGREESCWHSDCNPNFFKTFFFQELHVFRASAVRLAQTPDTLSKSHCPE